MREDLERGRREAGELAASATQRAKEAVDARKGAAADQVQQVATALDRAAGELGDRSPFSQYAGQFAGSVSQLAEHLRTRNADELIGDLQQMARRNPGLFVLGSVGVGFALARVLKATPRSEAGDGAMGTRDDLVGTGGDVAAVDGTGLDASATRDPRDAIASAANYEPPLGTVPNAAPEPPIGTYAGTPGMEGR
jgi:hypothetical protein